MYPIRPCQQWTEARLEARIPTLPPSFLRQNPHCFDGQPCELVFSDEFAFTKCFDPGDDHFWEAVDIWYGATNDLERHDPKRITMTKGMQYCGMLQSWNKFCFTEGGC